MTGAQIFGLGATALVGIGLYGLVVHGSAFRRLISFNIIGAGVFRLFGVAAQRGGGDPVPQALVITGLVVAFAASALAVALIVRLSAPDDTGSSSEGQS